jgi:homoserine O-acetyltransferase/O-succinyltransferase
MAAAATVSGAAIAPATPAPAPASAAMAPVESKIFRLGDVRLESGATLPTVELAYETYGALRADGRNAVLLCHGFSSSHHAAGRYAPGKAAPRYDETTPGWWDGLVGPGRPIDTDRLFVVASNMLGSSYGSTGPKSIDPRTGKPYGPDFPMVTLRDMISVQKRLVDSLGIKHLVMVGGPSFGGYQSFQWAVTHPDFMDGVVVAVSAPKGRGDQSTVDELIASLSKDSNWNGGRYYENGGIGKTMVEMRIATLNGYGVQEILAATIPDQALRDKAVRELAEGWAKVFDGNSLVALRRAAVDFGVEKELGKIKAKLLYVLSTTDTLFPAAKGPAVMEKLKAAGVDATFFELKSNKGHLASGADAELWEPVLQAFMDRLPQP